MQTYCKAEKPVQSLCFGLKKVVPIVALSLSALFTAAPVDAQTVGGAPYVNSWIGNTYGMPAKHIPHTIDNMYVTPSGKVAIITNWEEGGFNVVLYGPTGAQIGVPEGSGTGNWGRNSAKAVFVDDTYLYQSMTQHGRDGANSDPNQYPQDPITLWKCIRRYNHDGTVAPFTGGKGFDSSMLIVNSDTSQSELTGVVVYNGELFVSDPVVGLVKVYNASTMSQTPVRTFAIANPGLMDVDRLGFIWMLDTVQKKLIRFSTTGAIQSQSITFPSNVTPTSFCVDKVNDRILVTNNGNDQNVLIYTGIFGTPSQTSTFGNLGGINSGTAGAIAPLKFSEPKGVGIDSSGNIYVGNNGVGQGGGRLEKYNSGGSLQWRLNGAIFTANGDLNPANETEFYTHEHKFNLNLGNTTPGSEWSLAAQTLNKVKYPGDVRIPVPNKNPIWSSSYVRNVAGKKLLFVSDMVGYSLLIYRFNAATDGETAIPSGVFESSEPTESIWRDANGNGNRDSGETESKNADNFYSMHIFPDANGGVWKANREQGIRYFPMQGFDGNGNPQYSYASSIGYTPTELHDVKRVEYDVSNDVLYAMGRSASNINDDWRFAGDRLTRYNNATGARTTAWSVTLPYSAAGTAGEVNNVKALCEAGDYVFMIAFIDGRIYVHNKSDGSKVGEIMPTSATGNKSGWADINGAIRATKRSNGEYLIFAEENYCGKIMMYRWNPAGATPTPTPTGTAKARFYPRVAAEGPGRMVGGAFQGSADNLSWTDLGTISSTPTASTWTELPLSSVNYRYLRYLAPINGSGNVAEVEFYDGSTKITGTKFGTSGSWSGTSSDTFDKAMDGNTATYYDAAASNASTAHVGIDTGNTTPTPTPTMINRATGGTSSASSNPLASEAAANAFDGSVSSKWLGSKSTTMWLRYTFPNSKKYTITQYRIASGNDSPTRDPKNWTLQGLNGTTWVSLSPSQSNQIFSARSTFNSTYSVTNSTAYSSYRLRITALNGDNTYGQLSELQLLGLSSETG